jgi:hypothetical protein
MANLINISTQLFIEILDFRCEITHLKKRGSKNVIFGTPFWYLKSEILKKLVRGI